MRIRALSLLVLIVAFMPLTSVIAQGNLNIIVENIKNEKGNILVGLYDKASGFPRHVMDGKIVKITENTMKVTFSDVKAGNYAISVLHDENQNKDLDQNKLGIPKEGFGFSNNAMGIIGPPSFKKARIAFKGNEDMDITIKMKYMN